MPVTLAEAALAIEDVIPQIVNSTKGVGDCRAVAAIADRFEACAFQRTIVPSVPDNDSPIMPLEGQGTTQAVLDSWLAKGTLLGEDGKHCVFVAFMDVMRRPFQGSWTVQTITVLGTKQSVGSHLDELEDETATELERAAGRVREPLGVRSAGVPGTGAIDEAEAGLPRRFERVPPPGMSLRDVKDPDPGLWGFRLAPGDS